MSLILIILLVLLIAGGGYGWSTGYTTYSSPFGIILLILIVLVTASLIGGPRIGWW